MRRLALWTAIMLGVASGAAHAEEETWAGFLDYAYVYSSAEPAALRERLDRYAARAGMTCLVRPT